MYNLKYILYTVVGFVFLISGCSLVNSNNDKGIEITINSSVLAENDTILVELKNKSSEDILIYGDTINSQIQKKNSTGDWVRLRSWREGQTGGAFMNYYTNLDSKETYQYQITSELISNYTDEIEGEYRSIFELVYNQDYDNRKIVVSKNFIVE